MVCISCNSIIDIHVFCHSKDDVRIKPDLRHFGNEGDLQSSLILRHFHGKMKLPLLMFKAVPHTGFLWLIMSYFIIL